MAITIPVHRALTTKLAGRSLHVVTRWGSHPWIARVNSPSQAHDLKPTRSPSHSRRIHAIATRSYATSAAAKPAGRPKAHTGRSTAKRSTRSTTSKKPGPKTAAGKKNAGRGSAATKAKKPKAKPKKKAPSQTAVLRAKREKAKSVKDAALLKGPKRLPDSAWAVLFSEHSKGSTGKGSDFAKVAAQKYRNLTPEEREHYNHLAQTNKEQNNKAYQQWVSTFTPDEIRKANHARNLLRQQYKAAHPQTKVVSKFPHIQDDRLVKRPVSEYAQFLKARFDSGDFKGMAIKESSALIAREWKALSASDKQKYNDLATADRRRYFEEFKTVYGHDAPGFAV